MQYDTHIAIIGDGAAALATLAVLRGAGMATGEAAVYGDERQPLKRLGSYARAVAQERMRSEGEGHLGPEGFPDLALRDAWRRRTPLPMLASLFNLYTPPLELVIDHASSVARACGFEQAHVAARIGRLERVERPRCEFVLHDEQGCTVGRARHVILALGHPGLRWPAAAGSWRFHRRVAHAYAAPEFAAGEHVVVVGSGIAAVHTWLAALAAGAVVTAMHRSPLRTQPLNAARCMFSSAGIEAYRRLDVEERLAWLREQGGSYPWRWRWALQLRRASAAGRFVDWPGELAQIDGDERSDTPLTLELTDGGTLTADRLVFATGFRSDPCGHALVRQLVEEYKLPRAGTLLHVADDYTLAPLSVPQSTLSVVGALARLALPVADTFFGMKYAARRIAPRILDFGL
jgi:hypothetical protein